VKQMIKWERGDRVGHEYHESTTKEDVVLAFKKAAARD